MIPHVFSTQTFFIGEPRPGPCSQSKDSPHFHHGHHTCLIEIVQPTRALVTREPGRFVVVYCSFVTEGDSSTYLYSLMEYRAEKKGLRVPGSAILISEAELG